MIKLAWVLSAILLSPEVWAATESASLENDAISLSVLIALVGLIAAIVSLIWNFYQHKSLQLVRQVSESRDYALNAYDRHVVEPVEKALAVVDRLTEALMDIADSEDDRDKKRDKKIVEYQTTLGSRVQNAKRMCSEVDRYLEKQGYTGEFAKLLFHPKPDLSIDDILMNPVGFSDNSRAFRSMVVITAMDEISSLKATIRSALADKGREISIDIHEKFK